MRSLDANVQLNRGRSTIRIIPDDSERRRGVTARSVTVCSDPIYRVSMNVTHSNRMNAVTTNRSDRSIIEVDTLRIVRFVVE